MPDATRPFDPEWTSIGFHLIGRDIWPHGRSWFTIEDVGAPVFPSWRLANLLRPRDEDTIHPHLKAFGIPYWAEDIVAELTVRKMCSDPRYLPCDCCLTRDALRDLISIARIDVGKLEDVLIVEVGIHKSTVAQIRVPPIPIRRPSGREFADYPGRVAALEFGNRMHPDGEFLGFELCMLHGPTLLSWRHAPPHEAERVIEEEYVNDFGFFDDEYQASLAAHELEWDGEPWGETDDKGVITEIYPVVNALVMRHSVESVMEGAMVLPGWESVMNEMLTIRHPRESGDQ